MPVTRADVSDFSYFLAIARHRNLRLAGLEMGVSASALSHALKGLEGRLGVRLFHRTNRSVTLTAAGEELRDAIEAPFDAIGQAIDGLNRHRDAPAGRIRLNVPVDAAPLLLAPVLPAFVSRYPDVEVEIVASNRMLDVFDGGFDAGIRYGGTVPKEMVAQRLSADLRWVVAAAPSYLERLGTPTRPEDLQDHNCLKIRVGDGSLYAWEFMGPDGEFAIPVPGRITIDETRAMLSLGLQGVGLMYGPEPVFAPLCRTGDLRLVLEDWSTTGPGYHVYYSSRRQLPVGLRLLIDLIREMRPLGL